MGRDKAFLEVGGQLVIARVLDRVKSLTDDLLISTNSPEQYEQFGLRMVGDVYPDKAALGGIYSAIKAAQHEHVLIVACDLPLLNVALLRYLISLAPTADVVAPLITPPQPETTHAIYSKTCLPAIESRLLANKLRIIGFFDEVTVRYVSREEIALFDPDFYSFINMNTPEEWEKVKALAERQERS
jgi:molybdopterin-guanine dinucleotide biosynthesis protein A